MKIVRAHIQPKHQVIWICERCQYFQPYIPWDPIDERAVPCPECGDATEEGLNRGRLTLVPLGYLFVID